LNKFWVGWNELGLGFHRRRREFAGGEEERTERRKRKKKKMSEPVCYPFI